MKKKIFIAADHAGYLLKEKIKTNLDKDEYNIVDLGTDSELAVDYPSYGKKLGEEVVSHKNSIGIGVCGSGIGISIAANKVNGARAALVTTKDMASLAREHNDANIIALGQNNQDVDDAISFVKMFLDTKFSDEKRHQRRVKALNEE